LKFLLDTHVLLWWFKKDRRLSNKVSKIIEDRSNIVFASAASTWEISIKKAIGKLQAPDDIEEALHKNNFVPLPISVTHGVLAGQLPFHHDDPFDRIIIAQSIIEGLTLITRDQWQFLYDVKYIEA
jgi:PIN domain nuclease of toxin-antitoxin system